MKLTQGYVAGFMENSGYFNIRGKHYFFRIAVFVHRKEKIKIVEQVCKWLEKKKDIKFACYKSRARSGLQNHYTTMRVKDCLNLIKFLNSNCKLKKPNQKIFEKAIKEKKKLNKQIEKSKQRILELYRRK